MSVVSFTLLAFVGVVAVIILFLLLLGIVIYNRLVEARNLFQNAWSQIDVQLKRRYDLIPQLVEAVKGYLAHEQATLEAVIAARGRAVGAAERAAGSPGNAAAMKDLQQAEAGLAGALGRLLVVTEAYPDLKANENVMALQEEMTSTENRIGFARQAYNDSAMDYNIKRENFPAILYAGALGFQRAGMLEATRSEEEREPPKISFNS